MHIRRKKSIRARFIIIIMIIYRAGDSGADGKTRGGGGKTGGGEHATELWPRKDVCVFFRRTCAVCVYVRRARMGGTRPFCPSSYARRYSIRGGVRVYANITAAPAADFRGTCPVGATVTIRPCVRESLCMSKFSGNSERNVESTRISYRSTSSYSTTQ